MNDRAITADTLAEILTEVRSANAENPDSGANLFENSLEEIELLRSGALDETLDKVGVQL